jgi:glutamyl-tRNA synthetase
MLAEGLAEHLRRSGVEVADPRVLPPIADAFRERAKTLVELAEQAQVYVTDFDRYDPKAAAKHLTPASAALLVDVRTRLAALEDWTADSTQRVVEEVADASGAGLGKVAQPVRVAVTGGAASPGIGVTLDILGREKTFARLDRAIEFVGASSARGAS